MTCFLTIAQSWNCRLASSPLAAARLPFASGALESAVAQPRATFDGVELYQRLEEKAAALGFSLILNHPFIDGNQRIGHAPLEVFLVLNGSQLRANVDNAESMILGVAAGTVAREAFVQGIRAHMTAYLL